MEALGIAIPVWIFVGWLIGSTMSEHRVEKRRNEKLIRESQARLDRCEELGVYTPARTPERPAWEDLEWWKR